MKKEEKLEKCRKIKIQEKIELKEIEMQGDPCRNNQGLPCRYDCCRDCLKLYFNLVLYIKYKN